MIKDDDEYKAIKMRANRLWDELNNKIKNGVLTTEQEVAAEKCP